MRQAGIAQGIDVCGTQRRLIADGQCNGGRAGSVRQLAAYPLRDRRAGRADPVRDADANARKAGFLRLPEDFQPPEGVGVVLAQWHDQAELGDPAGKPPLAIRYLDGALRFTGAFSEVASQNPDKRYVFHEIADVALGRWLDFVFRIHWSKAGDSSIDAFLGRQRIFRFDGPLGYRNEIKGPYFKLGVYASGEFHAPVVAYHDNYSRGASYDEVDPSVLHIKQADRS